MKDEVTLITPDDQVIGSMDKIEAHRKPGKLHRAISVYLFRNKQNPELLIQKRSSEKIVGANHWANSACGNVWPNESYEDCAYRRLSYELGIDRNEVMLSEIYKFEYYADCNEEFCERELDHVFVGWYEKEPDFHQKEVSEVSWISWEACKKQQFEVGPIAPWFTIMLSDQQLLNKISLCL